MPADLTIPSLLFGRLQSMTCGNVMGTLRDIAARVEESVKLERHVFSAVSLRLTRLLARKPV
jgi:hypothetical protein